MTLLLSWLFLSGLLEDCSAAAQDTKWEGEIWRGETTAGHLFGDGWPPMVVYLPAFWMFTKAPGSSSAIDLHSF